MAPPAAAVFLVAILTAPAAPPPEGLPGPQWREGPARYLLTREEDRTVLALRSTEEHQQFVTAFWAARDPTPETAANEFQGEFRRRLEAANRLFAETSKPGWKTDRGKIYILMGPPDEIASAPMDAAGRGRVSWTYRSPPQADLGPGLTVRFAEDSGGEYRLIPDSFSSSPLLQRSTRSLFPPLAPGPPQPEMPSELYGRVQASRLQDVPFLQRPRVSVRWTPYSQPFHSCSASFLSEDGSTLAVMTLEVDAAFLREDPEFRPGELRVLGHLARLGGPERIDLGDLTPLRQATDSAQGRPLRFQGLRTLRPGRYRAYFALVDGRERLRGSYHEEMEVPALPPHSLGLSSLTLLEEIHALEGKEPRIGPFRMGGLHMVPRCRPVLAAGEELGLYYQIYDGRRGAEGPPAALEIEYRFELLLDGAEYPVGEPLHVRGATARAQGQTFRVEGWPPGSYRLTLTVRDPANDSGAVRQILFEIR
jgi:GWxTD domain-containing protein